MAIKRLIENMNIVQSLVIPGLDSDMDVIQKLDDEPNDVGGLTAQQLKAEFDKAGNIVKRYINEILLPALSDTVAEAEEREKAETERKRNEILRQEAEQQRADETTGIVAQATQQANQAMESKNTAVAASKKAEQSAAEAHSDAGIVRESVSIAQKNAKQTSFDRESIKDALDNLPAGAVPVIDNLTTGGAAVALSAEQGRLLGELANLTDYPRALYNLGAAPGVNLLDNWYFVGGGGPGQLPVNQRGQMKYAGIGYGIDRWKSNTDSYVEITADGLTIASEGSQFGYGLIYQAIPDSAWLIGRTVTLSVLMQGNLFTKSERIVDNPDAWSVSLSGGTARAYAVNQTVFFEFVAHSGGQLSGIQAVKLEIDPTQTLAHQEGGKWVLNEIPNYGEQLARCQAYQIELNAQRTTIPTFGVAMKGPTVWYAIIPLPVVMRATPVVALQNGPFYVECADGAFEVASIFTHSFTANLGLYLIHFANASPPTATTGTFYANNLTTPPSMILDANL